MRRFFFASVIAIGCGQEPGVFDPDSGACAAQNKQTQPLYANSGMVWDKRQVTVCWLNPEDVSAANKAMVKKFVTEGWDRHIDLDFIWTGKCTGCEDVFVESADERPHAINGIRRTVPFGLGVHVVLNFDFGAWGQGCDSTSDTIAECIEYEATHEFGHVLGFIHEQNRPDTPEWCIGGAGEQDGMAGDTTYGKWDDTSVMNYCSSDSVVRPSQSDIDGAISIYGKETSE